MIDIPTLVDIKKQTNEILAKKEAEQEPNIYLSVFMTWDEYTTGKSKYKRHFRGSSEEDVMKQFNDFLKQMDDQEITNILRY